jgi:hypothetical protein
MEAIVTPAPPPILLALIAMSGTLSLLLFAAELRYALENLRTQCYARNIHCSGNWPAYEAHLKADGIDVEALKQRNRNTQGMRADSLWYLRKIEEYTALCAPNYTCLDTRRHWRAAPHGGS